MGRRQKEKERIRNIQKSKGSYYVTLPIELIRKLKWQERQKVVVRLFGRGLRVKDWTKTKSK